MRRWHRRIRGIGLVATAGVMLAACGTSYGWVQDYNGTHATCGEERIGLDDTDLPEAYGATWKESTRDAACNRGDSNRYEAGPGHLGIAVLLREDGVICGQENMTYNPRADDAIGSYVLCRNPGGNQNFRATVVHRWWSQAAGNYAGVTRDTPTITA